MAQRETDREDLMREATALVDRIELGSAADSGRESITAGFRRDGALSIYFGADPVYQFNANGELRRAYCGELLFKAVRGRLVSLRRVRQDGEVQLLSRELTDREQDAFCARLGEELQAVAAQLTSGELRVLGQVPSEANVLGRLRDALAGLSRVVIAHSPRV